MSQVEPTRAARYSKAGRLVPFWAIVLGLVGVVLSAFAESALQSEWFWTATDREAARVRQSHFDKLYAALLSENSRRARAGKPPLDEEPEALRRSRARLEEAKRPMRIAQQRPGQVATFLRLSGLVSCAVGLGLLAWLREPPPPATGPSASDGAEAQ